MRTGEIAIPSIVKNEPGVLRRLGQILHANKVDRIALFWGENLRERLGRPILSNMDSEGIHVGHDAILNTVCADALFALSQEIPSDIDTFVAIGGGRAIDAGKYLAHLLQLPLISVPTIVSNDGFASPLSSLWFRSKRRTIKTRTPAGLIIDPEAIAQGPARYVYAGLGDLACKLTALRDCKLACEKGKATMDDFARLMAEKPCKASLTRRRPKSASLPSSNPWPDRSCSALWRCASPGPPARRVAASILSPMPTTSRRPSNLCTGFRSAWLPAP